MSRTHRNFPPNGRFLRKPKTSNEIKQNSQLEADIRNGDVPDDISKRNRRNRFIPTYWDDIFISIFK